MTQSLKALQRVSDSMERAVDKLMDDYAQRCTNAIKRQLQEWESRFPRHKFHAWFAHGILCFNVDPPVCGEKYVADLDGAYYSRGAIDTLGKEANAFLEVWSAMEWRVVSIPETDIIKAR